MIPVGVRKNYIFHVLRVQPNFLQAIQNFVTRGVVEQRLDEDNALAADDSPCAMDLGSQEIEIICDLGRFGIPGFPGRRTGSCSTATCAPASPCLTARSLGTGRRWNAEAQKRPRPIRADGTLGRRDVAIHCGLGACADAIATIAKRTDPPMLISDFI
jgi:hypothetical protein